MQVFASNDYPYLSKYNHTINIYLGSASDYSSEALSFINGLISDSTKYIAFSIYNYVADSGLSDTYFDKVGSYSFNLMVVPVSALNSTSVNDNDSNASTSGFSISYFSPFSYLLSTVLAIPDGNNSFYSVGKSNYLKFVGNKISGGCYFVNGFNTIYRNSLERHSTDNLTIKFHLGPYEPPAPPPVSSEPPPVSSTPIVPPYVPPNWDMVVFPPDAMEDLKDKVTGVINAATVIGMLAFGLLLIIPIMIKIIKHYTTRGGGVGG